jgi:cytochrome d ubiquinol oxidase subunit II
VPFSFESDLRVSYAGGLLDLVRPFPLLCGIASLAMLLMHGAAYLRLKTEGMVAWRAKHMLMGSSAVLIAMLAIGGLWVGNLAGYALSGAPDTAGPSNPLLQSVVQTQGAWLANYGSHPWMAAAPVLAFAGALVAIAASWKGRDRTAFAGSTLAVTGTLFTAGFSLFPFLLPSSSAPSQSLTIWDASSSQHTLMIMVAMVLLFLPLVILYTGWVFRVLRGKVTAAYVREHDKSLY